MFMSHILGRSNNVEDYTDLLDGLLYHLVDYACD